MVSEKQLEHAKKYVLSEGIDVEFFKSSVDKLDLEDEVFDYGLFIATLHCLESEEEREKALKENRCLPASQTEIMFRSLKEYRRVTGL